jgi:S-DNA-T family DNA segregation ATPase FtsK/SpoIIIE
MNTRGWDSSRLLPSHKGVGILRPEGKLQLPGPMFSR